MNRYKGQFGMNKKSRKMKGYTSEAAKAAFADIRDEQAKDKTIQITVENNGRIYKDNIILTEEILDDENC